jgi:hypothetical protein
MREDTTYKPLCYRFTACKTKMVYAGLIASENYFFVSHQNQIYAVKK